VSVNLYRVILPVNDINIAEKFYSVVLNDPGERVSPGRHYFKCGGTILACYDPVADGDGIDNGWKHHFNQYFYFSVSDLDETLNLLQNSGGKVESGIETMPWGEKIFYAKDPFGNPISFVDEETLFQGMGDNA
jgi:predicted enzyme related to lactoylglutathione lyase